MELASEDLLRLNVLLASPLQAVRIDESAMAVHGLASDREAVVRLNPSGREEAYLRRVREILSQHALGSPGGYPVYIQRWTRMGQARDESLERLLLLGEPEAVVAVVHAPGLTDELARRAWWAMPNAANARRMLARECVARGAMGPVLAEYLVEYLPFETESVAIMDTVYLVLQPGLIGEEQRQRIWSKGTHKNVYFLGFLRATPDALPGAAAPHRAFEEVAPALGAAAEGGNRLAALLLRCLGAQGQAFAHTVETVLRRPGDQEVVVALLAILQEYFAAAVPAGAEPLDEMARAVTEAEEACAGTCADAPGPGRQDPTLSAHMDEILGVAPQLRDALAAVLALARIGEPMIAPIFARTTATGTLMRRKIEPVAGPILYQLARLRGAPAS